MLNNQFNHLLEIMNEYTAITKCAVIIQIFELDDCYELIIKHSVLSSLYINKYDAVEKTIIIKNKSIDELEKKVAMYLANMIDLHISNEKRYNVIYN